MNKKIILLIVQSLLIAMLFSGSALSAATPADAAHSVKTDVHGCWFNELENGNGHYAEETGKWIDIKTLMK